MSDRKNCAAIKQAQASGRKPNVVAETIASAALQESSHAVKSEAHFVRSNDGSARKRVFKMSIPKSGLAKGL
jgi:hypothetical protein